MNFIGDKRPLKNGWAPGNYVGKCGTCNNKYVGDKRSIICADCAYPDEIKVNLFLANIERCNAIVQTWPKWKRDFLITPNSVKQRNSKPHFKYNWKLQKWELMIDLNRNSGWPYCGLSLK